jgi:excisionase family DNA binding protein
MDNLVIVKSEDLRKLIREELLKLPTQSETYKASFPPLTTKQLCEFLGISEPTVIRWRKKGKIPFFQIGSSLRYDKEAVLKALENTKGKGGSR